MAFCTFKRIQRRNNERFPCAPLLARFGRVLFLLYVFTLLIPGYCEQHNGENIVPIRAFEGDDVHLPCSYNSTSDFNLHWLFRDEVDIYRFTGGEHHLSDNYKDRVDVWPELFNKGNFSLTLKNVSEKDSGKYMCYVLPDEHIQVLQLIISEKHLEPPTEPPARTPSSTRSRELPSDEGEKRLKPPTKPPARTPSFTRPSELPSDEGEKRLKPPTKPPAWSPSFTRPREVHYSWFHWFRCVSACVVSFGFSYRRFRCLRFN